jgi:hypothetical protein
MQHLPSRVAFKRSLKPENNQRGLELLLDGPLALPDFDICLPSSCKTTPRFLRALAFQTTLTEVCSSLARKPINTELTAI